MLTMYLEEIMKQVDLLLSTTYAKNWIEAFPIGNGHIGAMDSGNPHATSISLNDDSLWSGYNANHNKDVSPEMWADIRAAIDAKNFSEAERLVHDNVLSAWADSYLPLGNINITRSLGNSSVDNYKRILDMSRSVQEVSFSVDNIAYKRTSFVSAVDDVYVANITTSLKDNADITLSSPLAASISASKSNATISISGRAPYYVPPPK